MSVTEEKGRNGLDCVRMTHGSGCAAEVYLNGAHITSWIAGGEEKLFLAEAARFAQGESIRGGIPVVFPQFANEGPLPSHGFARKSQWALTGHAEDGDVVRVTLRLSDDSATRTIWPHKFQLELSVALATSTLGIELRVKNTDTAAFDFTAALHTYLRVADIDRAALAGLEGSHYLDKTRANVRIEDAAPELVVKEETDRVYLGAPSVLTLHDYAADASLRVESHGFVDAVVWNPWREKGKTFSGMSDDDYRRMLCVEAAEVGEAVVLQPGEAWLGGQFLTSIGA